MYCCENFVHRGRLTFFKIFVIFCLGGLTLFGVMVRTRKTTFLFQSDILS